MENTVAAIYDQSLQSYLRSDLLAPESSLLGTLKGRWHNARLLDLGVGAGRTTWTFAPLVNHYVGLDISPAMVKQCQELFGEGEERSFVVGDASNLTRFSDGTFDVVLFSFNGIDHLSPDERTQCFREVKRVLKPGGHFFFSSHHLGVFPHYPRQAWKPGRNPFRWLNSFRVILKQSLFFRRVNRLAMGAEARQRGWAILPDVGHSYTLKLFYTLPSVQVEVLTSLGFEALQVLDMSGRPMDPAKAPANQWYLHYFCRKP